LIGILYSCHLCGIKNAEVQVRLREPTEDVIAWMEQAVIVTLSVDHDERSPHCHPEQLCDIKIPTDGRRYVGGPVEN
jgi:hypothetical protein